MGSGRKICIVPYATKTTYKVVEGLRRLKLNYEALFRARKTLCCNIRLKNWSLKETEKGPEIKTTIHGAGLFLESPGNFSGHELFYVCRVCIQDQSFNNFENDTAIKLTKLVNEAKLLSLWARNCARIFRAFRETGPKLVSVLSKKDIKMVKSKHVLRTRLAAT